jgi:hypothetical protein
MISGRLRIQGKDKGDRAKAVQQDGRGKDKGDSKAVEGGRVTRGMLSKAMDRRRKLGENLSLKNAFGVMS